MDGDEAGDAAGEDEGREYEGDAEGAGGVEAAVAAEGDDDISFQIRSLPAGEAAADFGDHGHFDEAAAAGTEQTACSQDLSEEEYRHSNLAAIRRMLQRSGSTGGCVFYYPT